MRGKNIITGKSGEELAVSFLEDNGYKVIARNYRNKLGEIDIIARDKDTISFVEVKTRSSDKWGVPAEAMSSFKQRQIAKTALVYLKENNLLGKKARFDLVSVLCAGGSPQVEILKNAFELGGEFVY